MSAKKNSDAMLNAVKKWNQCEVIKFLQENGLKEFGKIFEEKAVDGVTLLLLSEGVIAMWKPKVNVKKIYQVIEDLRQNPEHYLNKDIIKNEGAVAACDQAIQNTSKMKSQGLKVKPQVPIRTDSLIKNPKNIQANTENSFDAFKCKSDDEEKNIDSETSSEMHTEVNVVSKNEREECVSPKRDLSFKEINLLQLEAPKSFLYCKKMEKYTTKLNPYVAMNVKAQDAIILDNKVMLRNRVRKDKSLIYRDCEFNNLLSEKCDRGYYEMNRKSRRHSEGNIKVYEENVYEELNFFEGGGMKLGNTGFKKKMGILRRVLRKPTFLKENETKINNTDEVFEKYDHSKKNDEVSISKSIFKVKHEKVKKHNRNNYDLTACKMGTDNCIEKYKNNSEFSEDSKIDDEIAVFINDRNYIIKSSECRSILNSTDSFVDHCNSFYEEPKYSVDDGECSQTKLKDFSAHLYETAELLCDVDNIIDSNESKNCKNDVEQQANNSQNKPISLNETEMVKKEAKDLEESIVCRNDGPGVAGMRMVVEEYLEPRKVCDVTSCDLVMDTLEEEIMKLFDEGMVKSNKRELADLICFTIMGQGLSVSEQLKVDMALQDTQNTSFEDEVIAQSNKEFNKVDRTIDKSELTIQSLINPKMNKQITEHNEPPAKPPISKKPQIPKPMPRQLYMNQPIIKPPVNDRPFDTLQKWNESLRNSVKRKKESVRRAMFERPLPVPVENEFYYMNVGRKEAEKLLEGHADGTFILRPSSQSSHAYTLTLTFSSRIYNIGVRRRPDARLALGFSKPSEQSFISITDLIEHYYTEKLVLLVDGRQVGCTQLRRINDRNVRED